MKSRSATIWTEFSLYLLGLAMFALLVGRALAGMCLERRLVRGGASVVSTLTRQVTQYPALFPTTQHFILLTPLALTPWALKPHSCGAPLSLGRGCYRMASRLH